MEFFQNLVIVVAMTPLIMMMMILINGRDAFPETMLLFWKAVLFLSSGEKAPESKRQQGERLVEGSRVFAEKAHELVPLIGPNVDHQTRKNLKTRRRMEHTEWSSLSGIWPDIPIQKGYIAQVEDDEDEWTIQSIQAPARPCKHHPKNQICYRCDR